METIRQEFFLTEFIKKEKSLMFVGPTGTGKTAVVINHLINLPKERLLNNINVFVSVICKYPSPHRNNSSYDFLFIKVTCQTTSIFQLVRLPYKPWTCSCLN